MPENCVWTEDTDEGYWQPSCGADPFVLNDGGPVTNKLKFCCYCGRPLVEATVTTLECPCCGCEGAESDDKGRFHDGQALICGCPGWVSVDSDDGQAWINNGDDPCRTCEGDEDEPYPRGRAGEAMSTRIDTPTVDEAMARQW